MRRGVCCFNNAGMTPAFLQLKQQPSIILVDHYNAPKRTSSYSGWIGTARDHGNPNAQTSCKMECWVQEIWLQDCRTWRWAFLPRKEVLDLQIEYEINLPYIDVLQDNGLTWAFLSLPCLGLWLKLLICISALSTPPIHVTADAIVRRCLQTIQGPPSIFCRNHFKAWQDKTNGRQKTTKDGVESVVEFVANVSSGANTCRSCAKEKISHTLCV